MRIRWTARARAELREIGRYIARDKPEAARRWVARLQQRAREAAEMPLAGRMVPELGQENLREVLVRGYRIIYRVSEDAIDILTIFEGHRLLRRETLV